ncbi:uncharacterized protein F5147DRAFT_757360 [Suillus discolor]|uniref:Transmembrane protein n=1 Tax=Suillus discolor TaxID=1912936 RepID=A0A9P7K018_9AGAM|nr:uncharacterized protein F5147DRAFT_757360 [Suillus discolor]KAG2118957.1 hypothetical protein F5147DRAFT_757360 [Suillus discolor]
MVDWKTSKEIKAEGIAFTKVVYVLFGIYIWEICTTGGFELSVFLGRRKLAWPLVFFFLCRYSMLFAFIGLIIFVNISTKIDCNAVYTFTFVAGNLTILSASTSLMIRTMTLWEWERRAVLSMLALSFGKCAILIGTIMTVQASWDSQAGACIVVRTNHILLNLNYAYTMSFDFLILVMTLFVLRKRFRHEDLSGLLRRDGLVYFLITSTCNTVPAVLAALNFNNEMNVIAMVPAAAVSAITACRVFIHLDAYNKGDGEKPHNNPLSVNHNSTSPSVSPRSPSSSPGPVSFLPLPSPKTTTLGIRATMGTVDSFGKLRRSNYNAFQPTTIRQEEVPLRANYERDLTSVDSESDSKSSR